MRLGSRAKLTLLALFLLAPIAASFTAYYVVRPTGGAGSYGELLMPPDTVTPQSFARAGGGRFAFAELAGQWVMVASEAAICDDSCIEKLTTMRQVRLALGRRASRVARVFVAGTGALPPRPGEFEGMVVASSLAGTPPAPGPLNDREHIYLVDPHGHVMMRWPARADPKRMLQDLDRLLRASQIG